MCYSCTSIRYVRVCGTGSLTLTHLRWCHADKKLISVLLIEDSPCDARLVQDLLRKAEFEHFAVAAVSTLAEGLDQLTRDVVDVIILDLGLPDSQGLETLRAVHQHAPRLPIIVLGASDDENVGRRAVQEGTQPCTTFPDFTSK